MNAKNKNVNLNKKSLLILMVSALFVLSSGGYASADFTAINTNTGFSSSNIISSTGTSSFTQVDSNTQSLSNSVTSSTILGDNDSDNNTGSGTATSGSAHIMGSFENSTNLNLLDQSTAWWAGSFMSENDTTGAESDNTAITTFSADTTVSETNSTEIDNSADVSAETGENSSNNNTGSGLTESGDAETDLSVNNTANGNGVALMAMNEMFEVATRNFATGFSSTNTSVSTVTNTADISGTNEFNVSNDVFASMDTGNNDANGNTGDGKVVSGIASTQV